MTPGRLAARRAEANKRIKASTAVFSEKLGVDPPVFDGIPMRITPDVVMMLHLEALADWMDAVIEAASVGPDEAAERRAARGLVDSAHEEPASLSAASQAGESPTMAHVIEALNADQETITPEQRETLTWFLNQLPSEMVARARGEYEDDQQPAQGDQAQGAEAEEPPAPPTIEAAGEPAADTQSEPQEAADDRDPEPDAAGDGSPAPAPGQSARAKTGKAGKS